MHYPNNWLRPVTKQLKYIMHYLYIIFSLSRFVNISPVCTFQVAPLNMFKTIRHNTPHLTFPHYKAHQRENHW
jgi:hypothetical protein